jgi:hypothetical protein
MVFFYRTKGGLTSTFEPYFLSLFLVYISATARFITVESCILFLAWNSTWEGDSFRVRFPL